MGADYVSLDVATVTLVARERRELTIDAAPLLPGSVRGTIRAGGAPLADVHCFLQRVGPDGTANLRIATDADGRFEGTVPAGVYGFAMTYPAQPGPGWMYAVLPDRWQLAPGAVHEVHFDVPLRRVRIRVLDVAGEPVPDLRLRVLRDGYSLPGGLTTDANGECELYPAPFDAFRLQLTPADGGAVQELGPFDLPAGQTSGVVSVQLPRR